MRKSLIIAIYFLFGSFCLAMTADSTALKTGPQSSEDVIRVDTIQIFGNKVTDDDIILRELTFKPGDLITKKTLSYNRERIFSLSLFTSVKLYAEHFNNLNAVIIDVKESWYIWPVPFIDIKDNALNKATYGLNIQYMNFRGRNESLKAVISFGYDPVYGLGYFSPYFLRDENIYFSTELYYKSFSNKSNIAENLYGGRFDHKIISGYVNLGRRLNQFNSAGIYLGYDYVETPKYVPGISASNGRVDHTPKLGIGYLFDTRNLKQFPDSGFYASMDYSFKGFGLNDVSYSILSLDLRQYQKIWGDLTGKWRLASRFAFGRTVPFYDFSYIGFGEKVRGHFNDIKEGHRSYVGSVELKYPLLKEWNFSISLPGIPEQLSSYRIGVYPYVFLDAGGTQLRGNSIGTKDFYSGYGTGLIILFLPYNIFRVELAFDEYRNEEFIFGFGFSF